MVHGNYVEGVNFKGTRSQAYYPSIAKDPIKNAKKYNLQLSRYNSLVNFKWPDLSPNPLKQNEKAIPKVSTNNREA